MDAGIVEGIKKTAHFDALQMIDADENPFENEGTVLIKEIQHRMKNNLQLILSLINIQLSQNVEDENKDFLLSLKQRVQSLSITNQILSHSFNTGMVCIKEIINGLIDSVSLAYTKQGEIIVLKHIEPVFVEQSLAVPIGLIVNELMTNSYKYAFPPEFIKSGNKICKIEIILYRKNGKTVLIISNNGIPMEIPNISALKSSGIKLVHSLVQQLEGDCHIDYNSQQGGITYTITF